VAVDIAAYGAGALNIFLIGFLIVVVFSIVIAMVYLIQKNKRFSEYMVP
jgi:hypothetical protein